MRILIVFTFCLIISVTNSSNLENEFESEWHTWKYEHNKQYESQEHDQDRKAIFVKNLLYIEGFNKEKHSFTLALNKFADLTNSEYQQQYLTKVDDIPESISEPTSYKFDGLNSSDGSIDWRSRGAVGAIKNQGTCKCGWAFSATGCLEGQYQITGHGFEVLSEQQLVDCSSTFGNNGCYGGSVKNAYNYWRYYKEERGSAYPYTGMKGTCRYDPNKGIVDVIPSYHFMPKGYCSYVFQALYYIGPISVAIDASRPSFQFYKTGIYSDSACNINNLNHAVLITAYYQPEDYYWVKNSYGDSWGIGGNFKIKPLTNMCGICQQGSFPILY